MNTRRRFLQTMAAGAAIPLLRPVQAQQAPVLMKAIPSTQERIPAVGLGSWITFNVGQDATLRDECAAVMAAFFDSGGRLIDSSPMYGSAQAVIGYGLRKTGGHDAVFSADKVWTSHPENGPAQVQKSAELWGVPHFDLLQVHNLLSWRPHLETLAAMKQAGQLSYIGITTSEGRRHDELERIMHVQPLDFVQLTYNIVDREAEQRLLPLAMDRGMGIIVNRPFQQGTLLRRLAQHPLPPWAADIQARSWAQFVLKFIASHPAVTCAIPATTRVDHVRENMASATGPMPDAAMRARMAAYVQGL